MDSEFVRAPPLPIALAKLGLMLAVGTSVVWLFRAFVFPWMHGYLETSATRSEAVHRATMVMLGAGAFIFALAVYVIWLGIRVLQQGQWPLAGSFVLRDTPVKRGRWVRARGIVIVVLGVLLAANAIGLALVPHFVLK
jgi:hypothetical protein